MRLTLLALPLFASCTLLSGFWRAACGNGLPEEQEECDDGNDNDLDLCTNNCTLSDSCGDGVLVASEECDDGNNNNLDGCDNTCNSGGTCRNGQVDPGELCLTATQALLAPSGQRGIESADFNRDGLLDLAVTNIEDNTVGVYLRDPRGFFGAAKLFAVGILPNNLAASDLNADGHIDLAVANFASNDVSILSGDGTGSFVSEAQVAVGNGPFDIDVIGGDLIVSLQTNDALALFVNNGAGSFSPSGVFPVELGPTELTTEDFNQDGLIDIAVSNTDADSVSVLLDDGGGTFVLQPPLPSNSPIGIASGDLDDDGFTDLVVAESSLGALSIFFGNGNGSFEVPLFVSVGNFPFSVTLVDVNQDNNLDIANTNQDGTVSILLNFGNGDFFVSEVRGSGVQPNGLISEDFDRDGFVDLAVTDSALSFVNVFGGDGDGSFAGAVSLGTNDAPGALVIADINGGAPDLAVLVGGGDTAQVFSSDGINLLLGLGASADARDLIFAEVTGDGAADLIITNSGSSSLSLFINEEGNFSIPVDIFAGGATAAVISIDFNDDALVDLVALDSLSNGVRFIQSSGGGVFEAPVSLQLSASPVALVSADFEADGDQDVVVALNDGSISVLENQSGTFAGVINIPIGISLVALAAADLDGDSLIDLVIVDEAADEITLLSIDLSSQTLSAGDAPRDVVVADVNADFNVDLLVASRVDGHMGVFLGDGAGGFEPQISFIGGLGPLSIATEDINQDNVLDIVTSNSLSDDLLFFLSAP